MEKQEDQKSKVAVVAPVFLRKVNVAAAVFLIFLNAQSIIYALLDRATPAEFAAGTILTIAALIYGLFAINAYMTKIFVYETGITIKSLFRKRTLEDIDIEYVAFNRINMRKMLITIRRKAGKPITISTAKFQGCEPLVDYLAKFKKPAPDNIYNTLPAKKSDTRY